LCRVHPKRKTALSLCDRVRNGCFSRWARAAAVEMQRPGEWDYFPRRPTRFSALALLFPLFLQLRVQLLTLNTKDARGLGFVPFGAIERPPNYASLQAGYGLIER
jgi:hypothetical protein